MRDLASIVSVKSVWSLEGKDRVQGCNFNELGYEAMVGKEIQPGDKVCFIQEGSILPVKKEWEFLRKRCFRESINGFLIKPQKFGTIKSWGLVVSLKDLPLSKKDYKIGEDLTEALEIRKYEPEEEASPTKNTKKKWWISFLCHLPFVGNWFKKFFKSHFTCSTGGFPTDVISKSDETTIQNCPSVIERFNGSKFYISGKMEGQSFLCFMNFDKNKNKFKEPVLCGRNTRFRKNKPSNIFWKCFIKYDLENKLKKFYKKYNMVLVLQGEQVGPTIQENIYNFKDNEWYVYTIKDFLTGRQLSVEEMITACKELGLKTVPILDKTFTMGEDFKTIDDFVKYAENVKWVKDTDNIISYFNDKNCPKKSIQHEGIVVRSLDYDKDNHIGFSFKVKNLDYQEKGLKELKKKCVEYFGG